VKRGGYLGRNELVVIEREEIFDEAVALKRRHIHA